MKARISFFLVLGILTSVSFAEINLKINPSTNALDISNDTTVISSLKQGTIGSLVKVGNESFRVSYGKDVHGSGTAVIYRDSSMTGEVNLHAFGEKVTVGERGMVNVTLEKGSPMVFESGPVAVVTVMDKKLASRGKLDMRQVLADRVAAEKALALQQKEAAKAEKMAKSEPAKVEAPATVAKTDEVEKVEASVVASAKIDQAVAAVPTTNIVARVQGEVVSGMKNDAAGSKLVLGEALAEGTVISTAQGSSATIQLLPGVFTLIDESTTVELTKVATTDNDGYDILLNVKKGTIFCDIQNKGASNKNLRVQTPEGIAAAHGTNFCVTTIYGKMWVRVVRGVVSVVDFVPGQNPGTPRFLQANQRVELVRDGSNPNSFKIIVSEVTEQGADDKPFARKGNQLALDANKLMEMTYQLALKYQQGEQTPGSGPTTEANNSTLNPKPDPLNPSTFPSNPPDLLPTRPGPTTNIGTP